MNAKTYHEIMSVIALLDSALTSHRFSQDRKGMIPPDQLQPCINDLYDAVGTIDMLLREDDTVSIRRIR